MAKGPALVERLSPLALALVGSTVLVLLMAFGLVWTSLNEFRSGTGFRKVLLAYGAGAEDLAASALPSVLEAKPRRYPHPRLMDALLKMRAGDVQGAAGRYQEVLDEKETMLTEKEKAVCLNGLGVARFLSSRGGPEKDRKLAVTEAKEHFRKATEAWRELPESWFNLAALEFAEGKFEDARKRLGAATAADLMPPGPDLARNLVLMRMVLAEQAGGWDQAVAEARRLKGYSPGGVTDAHGSIDARAVLARILYARELSRQIRRSPLPDRPNWMDTDCDVRLQEVFYENLRDRDRGEGLANVAAWRMEAYWAAHLRGTELPQELWPRLRATIQERLGQASKLSAKLPQDYVTVVALRCVQWSRDLLWRASSVGREEASGSFQPEFKYLAESKEAPERTRALAKNNLAYLLAAHLDRPDEALAAAKEAAALAPGSPVAALNLAILLDRKGDAESAIAAYEQALSLKPGQAAVEARIAALKNRPPPEPAP